MGASLKKKKNSLVYFLLLIFLFLFLPVWAFSFDRKTKYVFSSNYPLVPVEADIIIVTSSLCHCFISPRPYPLTRKKNTSLSFVALVLLLLLFFSFFASLPLTPARSLPRLPPPSPKSSEGHPGARRVAVMSANEPIDNLSTGWLVLQALTMCFTENFLARNHSLLDPRPAMPSAWA